MRNVEKYLTEPEVEKIAAELIQIPSYSFLPQQEQAVADYLSGLLSAAGIEVYQQQVSPGRPNVIARIPGSGGPSLMLCGHMDTVPPYDMAQPLSGRVENGVLFGRGACDMKGALAAMASAMLAVKRSGERLSGDLLFCALVDEEEGGSGAEYLAEHGPFASAAIIGEPTGMSVGLGHKGLEWMRVDFAGKKVHGGDQNEGVNAIQMAARFVNTVYDEYAPLLAQRKHPVLGEASINMGRIEGGDQPSTVAGECFVLLDRRSVPGETREQVYSELEGICEKLHGKDPRFSATVYDLMENVTRLPHLPYCLQEDADVVQAISAALESLGKVPEHTSFRAWSDAGTLAAYTKCLPLVCGPGQLKLAHSMQDSVETAELLLAAKVYALTALEYLGG